MGTVITQSMGSEHGASVQYIHRFSGEFFAIQFFMGMLAAEYQCMDATSIPV